MINKIFFFSVFFLGANVLSKIGIDKVLVDYILVVYAILNFLLFGGKNKFKNRKFEFSIILTIILTIVLRSYFGIMKDSFRSIIVLIISPLFFMSLPSNITNRKELNIGRGVIKILLSFYVLECVIAIIEYVLKTQIFKWENITFDDIVQYNASFRSVAIHGSPLNNALIVTIINSFIILSPFKDKYKIFFWSLGFIASLAFNARIAVFVNVFLLAIYIFQLLASKKVNFSTKLFVNIGIVIFLGFTSYLVFFQGLGDRLFKTKLMDESSAQTRVDLFSIFDTFPISYFMYGKSMDEFDMIMQAAGLRIIENFWVCEIILFGILFVFILLFLYIKLFRNYAKGYTLFYKILIFSTFVLLASINNSLFTQYIPLLTFLICLNLFRHNIIRIIVAPKYINKNYYT